MYSILFLCTGNSARSIMAESIVNTSHSGKFLAYSAGSHPKGFIDPIAMNLLTKGGYGVSHLRSKSWSEFSGPAAPALNFVFTVCDKAAQETCPVWPGQPVTAHWGVPDPSAHVGSDVETAAFYAEVMRTLQARIRLFAELPLQSLDRLSLQSRLNEIGLSTP